MLPTKEELIAIYVWPDGTFCESDDLNEAFQYMSDDYTEVELTDEEYANVLAGVIDPQSLLFPK